MAVKSKEVIASTEGTEIVIAESGIHDGPSFDSVVDPPPARPYSEAITESHREYLSARGVEV